MPAPQHITAVDEFSDVSSPGQGEVANSSTFAAGIQALANRTLYVFNRLANASVSLAANSILGRGAAGPSGSQPATPFTFSMLALASARTWLDALQSTAAEIASAATTNIAGADGWYVKITGTTSISGFGLAQEGVARLIRFTDALTLTHNDPLLVLPGGANIDTQANDMAVAVSDGDGNWRIALYSRPIGAAADIDTDDFVLVDGTNPFTAPVAGATPTSSAHLSTKGYTDTGDAAALDAAEDYADAGDTSTLTAAQAYADAIASGVVIKDSALAMSDANIASLTGLAVTVDDVALDTDGMRVLLTAQTTGSQNGIWVVHSGAWTRATDLAAGSHAEGALVFIEEGGTDYGDTSWACSTAGPTDVVGTDATTWTQFGGGSVTAGPGLVKVGNTVSADFGTGANNVRHGNDAAYTNTRTPTDGTVTAAKIVDDAVTNAKLANVATATIKGRATAGTGDPEDLTTAQVKTLLGLTNVTDDAALKRAAGDFATFTAKTTPVGADIALIEDSAAGGAKKRSTLAQFAAYILTAITHQQLSGAGVRTHTEIDAHIASTSNPHATTKAQVGLTNVTDDPQLKRAAGDFATFTAKATPVAADILLLEDSAAAGAKKKVTVTQLLSQLTAIVSQTLQQVYAASGALNVDVTGGNTLLVQAADDLTSPTPLFRLLRGSISFLTAPRALQSGSSPGGAMYFGGGAGASKTGSANATAGGAATHFGGAGGNAVTGIPAAGGPAQSVGGVGGSASSGSHDGAVGGDYTVDGGPGGSSAGGAPGANGSVRLGTLYKAPLYSGMPIAGGELGSDNWTHRGTMIIESRDAQRPARRSTKRHSDDPHPGNLWKLIDDDYGIGNSRVRRYTGSGGGNQFHEIRTVNAWWSTSDFLWYPDVASVYSLMEAFASYAGGGGKVFMIKSPTGTPWADDDWDSDNQGYAVSQASFSILQNLDVIGGGITATGNVTAAGDVVCGDDIRYSVEKSDLDLSGFEYVGDPGLGIRLSVASSTCGWYSLGACKIRIKLRNLPDGMYLTRIRALVDATAADKIKMSLSHATHHINGTIAVPNYVELSADANTGSSLERLSRDLTLGTYLIDKSLTEYYVNIEFLAASCVLHGIGSRVEPPA